MKSPVEEMAPQLVVHVDGRLAENCLVAFSCTVTVAGDTVTAEAGKHMKRTMMVGRVRDSARFKRISKHTALS